LSGLLGVSDNFRDRLVACSERHSDGAVSQEVSMKSMRRRLLTIGLTTLVVGPMVAITTAAPAQAISCSAPDTGSWQTVREVDVRPGGAAVLLRLDNEQLNDESRAIAFGDLIAGDRIWVERRANSSSAWEQCPKTTVSASSQVQVTANRAAGNVGFQMRACFDWYVAAGSRSTVCTAQYTDTSRRSGSAPAR
jgi:hypothetical protein